MVLALAVAASAQRPAATAAQEWRTYDHDLAGTRFSPLTEINAGNVAKLAKAWTFSFPPSPGGRGGPLGLGSSEAVPLVIAGVMYLPASNTVFALEADTGIVIWQREIGGGPGPGTRRIAAQRTRLLTVRARALRHAARYAGQPMPSFSAASFVPSIRLVIFC